MAIFTVSAISCTKEGTETDRTVDPAYVGEWHLTKAVSEGVEIPDALEVYLCLMADGTFELYQKSPEDQMRYDKYTGTWYCTEGLLVGEYSDGTPWGAKYTPVLSGNKLVLKSTDLMEVQTYEKGVLAEEEKEDANLMTPVKSGNRLYRPIL